MKIENSGKDQRWFIAYRAFAHSHATLGKRITDPLRVSKSEVKHARTRVAHTCAHLRALVRVGYDITT